jgi:hypothetical protein
VANTSTAIFPLEDVNVITGLVATWNGNSIDSPAPIIPTVTPPKITVRVEVVAVVNAALVKPVCRTLANFILVVVPNDVPVLAIT